MRLRRINSTPLECPFHRDLRCSLNNGIHAIALVNLDVILFGDGDLNLTDNKRIFSAVHNHIRNSGIYV